MTPMPTDQPLRTLAQALGHEPSPALRKILRLVFDLPGDELNYLKVYGLHREQLDRIATVPAEK